MSRYSVAHAKNNLSALIAAAERGEEVVITRYDRPAVVLKAVEATGSESAPSQAEWLARIRALTANMPMSDIDSGTLLRNMRDEVDGF
jgi:prevent-host-death family protein